MSILDLHADSINEDIQRRLKNPTPPPEESFSTWNFGKAGFKGPVSAGFETAGTLADILSAYGTTEAASGAGVPMFSLPTATQRKAQDEASQRLLKGDAFDNTAGTILRRKANDFAPAETAHTAEKVVHGLTRFATKAVANVATMGPIAGAAALAGEEGNTVTQNLREKGIDTLTAAKVGAVTGVLSGVGVVLPIAGSTIAKTAALVAVGGPGSFMAQEAISREILQRANYPEEAASHDPTDPLGLALSTLIPGAFGAYRGRQIKRETKALQFAKESELHKAAAFTPDEQARSDAYERSPGNLAELQKAIKSEKNPEAVALLKKELEVQTELAKKFGSEPVSHPMDVAANDPEVVAAARVNVTNEALAKSLPDHPQARAEVMRAADMVAAGERVDVLPMIPTAERDANLAAFMAESKVVDESGVPLVVYKGMYAYDWTKEKSGDPGPVIGEINRSIDFPAFDPADNDGVKIAGFFGGKDVANHFAQGDRNAVFPAYLSVKNPFVIDAGGAYAGSVQFGPSGKPFRDAIKSGNYDGVIIKNTADEGTIYVALNPEQIKSAIGNSGKYDPTSSSLTDPLPRPEPVADTRNDLPPADAVTAKLAEPAKPPEPTIDRARMRRLEEENPDLQVRLPGSDKTVSLKDAMESAKAEAEFEANEASLYKAAVDCALSYS